MDPMSNAPRTSLPAYGRRQMLTDLVVLITVGLFDVGADVSLLIQSRDTPYVRRTTGLCLPGPDRTPRISEAPTYSPCWIGWLGVFAGISGLAWAGMLLGGPGLLPLIWAINAFANIIWIIAAGVTMTRFDATDEPSAA